MVYAQAFVGLASWLRSSVLIGDGEGLSVKKDLLSQDGGALRTLRGRAPVQDNPAGNGRRRADQASD